MDRKCYLISQSDTVCRKHQCAKHYVDDLTEVGTGSSFIISRVKMEQIFGDIRDSAAAMKGKEGLFVVIGRLQVRRTQTMTYGNNRNSE